MTPLQRSAHRLARADRRAATRQYAAPVARSHYGSPYAREPRPIPAWLAHIAQAIAIGSAIAMLGLASYHWHARDAVPQCLATSYDDCE